MRQTFRLLVTRSRTWDDTHIIEHALAVILAHHPRSVPGPQGMPAEPTPSLLPTPTGHPDTTARHTPRTGTVTAGAPDTCATSCWSRSVPTAANSNT